MANDVPSEEWRMFPRSDPSHWSYQNSIIFWIDEEAALRITATLNLRRTLVGYAEIEAISSVKTVRLPTKALSDWCNISDKARVLEAEAWIWRGELSQLLTQSMLASQLYIRKRKTKLGTKDSYRLWPETEFVKNPDGHERQKPTSIPLLQAIKSLHRLWYPMRLVGWRMELMPWAFTTRTSRANDIKTVWVKLIWDDRPSYLFLRVAHCSLRITQTLTPYVGSSPQRQILAYRCLQNLKNRPSHSCSTQSTLVKSP